MEDRAAVAGRQTRLLGRAHERAALDDLLSKIRRGESCALVLTGEAGIGKTALLEYLLGAAADMACVRAVGVESEMELPYASLHQLCAPLLDHLDKLPAAQRVALEVVFGITAGSAPDRLLVGLATLTLLSEAGAERPLLCLVDDAQWLDHASASAIVFVARRLLADPIGLVFATRHAGPELQGLPELELRGLDDGDARALLGSMVRFSLDSRVRERLLAEARGNPLALLELPRGLSATDLAGFGTEPTSGPWSGAEESFRRQILTLPEQTRRLLLLAAAEPLGDPSLFWRSADLEGIAPSAAEPAAKAGLCEFGAFVRFRHPLVRAVAYRTCSADERRRAHASLARATDADVDPDRRAWHRALALAAPDDAAADELERSAARARGRGGQAAAAAFLERAASLTLDPERRAERALAAAEAKALAGSWQDALRLAALAEDGPLDQVQRVRADVLRARVATLQRRPREAPPLLLGAAERLAELEPALARETYRDAFIAATYAGRFAGDTGVAAVAESLRAAAPYAGPHDLTHELLSAAALLIDAGWPAGAATAQRVVAACCDRTDWRELDLQWLFFAVRILALSIWDPEPWHALVLRALKSVRDGGVLALLPMAAAQGVGYELFAGDLASAAALVAEQDTAQEAIGGEHSPGSRIALAAFRGREREVADLDGAETDHAVARGDGPFVAIRHWSTAVLCNGLGRYDQALAAAQLAVVNPWDLPISNWALSELVEAAARCGQPEAAAQAVGRLAEMARACGTDWIKGVDARARALVVIPTAAEELFHDALEHLSRTRLRTEVARTQLLYGEWLRREQRRVDAREQLRTAYDRFSSIGMEAFAERARMELLATGETVRKRRAETRDELTPQEWQIAQLARAGMSNREIGARLFLSHRTVESHLSAVYSKLGIRARRELTDALASSESRLLPT